MNCEDCAHEKVCEGYSNCEEVGLCEPKRPHGEWVESKERKGHFYCSECVQKDPETGKWRETFDFKYPFCPNCGASMRVKDELNRVSKELNSEIENSKSEIVPDYRDGWRLRGEAE